MKCINFDAHFADWLADWSKSHMDEYPDFEAMEGDMPGVWNAFLNTPAQWLDGVTPGAYFTQFEDPKDLVDWLKEYTVRNTPVPEPLLEQIQFVGRPCEKRLVALLKDDDAPDEAKSLAVGLLRDMGSDLPKMLYISWQLDREQEDDLADHALEALLDMGKKAVQSMVEALPRCNDAGQEALLDVLANYPGNEQVFRTALRLFEQNSDRRALFAGYLAKLGDERALPALEKAAQVCGYIDYIEIRCAIEGIGGNCPERSFDGDAEYEMLKGLE